METVNYHNYRLNNEPFIDGTNLYYDEISKLLIEQNNSKPHNIRNILLGKEKFNFKNNDVLLSNIGPYAFIYHFLRKKYNLNFKIIRDIQTSFWPGYLLQEKLCEDYTQEGDKVLFLSEFTRQLFIKLFPKSLNENNTFVCAPFRHFFPKKIKREINDKNFTLGWVGKVTEEKNFDQILEAFSRIKKEIENSHFLIVGERCSWKMKKNIEQRLVRNDIPKDSFTLLTNVPHKNIWDLYKKLDIFLFPSTSLNESLGRVILEAGYCGIPVIAAHYATAPQLLDKKNLLSVSYRQGWINLTERPYYAGKICIDSLIEKIFNYKKLSKKIRFDLYKNHDKKFIDILLDKQCKEKLRKLDAQTDELIKNIVIYNMRSTLSHNLLFEKLKNFILKENFYCNALFHYFVPTHLGFDPSVQFLKDNMWRFPISQTVTYIRNYKHRLFKNHRFSKEKMNLIKSGLLK